jgi:predicted TIM-barrel fold metal-dependent hydrolase
MWINLGGDMGIDTIDNISKGRMMTTISDYVLRKELNYKPEEIDTLLKKGFVGYKMWFAPYQRRIHLGKDIIKFMDEDAIEPTFAAMEKAGMPGASIHIADPNGPFWNRGEWCTDPAEFWRMIIGLERVLQRHPDLVIVAAHAAWLTCQDAQIDFLRYLLATYPNLYVDLAATDQYYNLVNQENLRDFFITYADRILFGTDIVGIKDSEISGLTARYTLSFQILETKDQVEGSFFGKTITSGLNLPKDVLEKIYYKNALKIYPGLSERMINLGYNIGK